MNKFLKETGKDPEYKQRDGKISVNWEGEEGLFKKLFEIFQWKCNLHNIK